MSDWRDIKLLYVRELRSALRERNIVVNSILLPVVLYPLLIYLAYTGITFVNGQTEKDLSRVALRNFPIEHVLLKAEIEQDDRIQLVPSENPEEDIRKGRLDLVVEFLPDSEVSIKGRDGSPSRPGRFRRNRPTQATWSETTVSPRPSHPYLLRNFRARLICDESRDRSSVAIERLTATLDRYRIFYLNEVAARYGIEPAQWQPFWIERHNVATGVQMGRFILGLVLPLFLVIMLSAGTVYPAIDSTAGEREKSTWETLMTTATPRRNIIVAKYLYVATMSSAAGLLNLAAMLISTKQILAPLLGSSGNDLAFTIPLSAVPVILVGVILLAMFIAAGMMILASFARTFKEGQSMVTPFYLLTILPVVFLQTPGVEFTPVFALIPLVNVTMVFREAIAGVYHWPLIGLTLLVEALSVILCLKLAGVILHHEDVLMGGYAGSFSKFVRQRLFGGKAKSGGEKGGR